MAYRIPAEPASSSHVGITEKARRWLDIRYRYPQGRREEDKCVAHAYHNPIHVGRLMGVLGILYSVKDQIHSVVDIGCGDGYPAALARALIPSCNMTITDLSYNAVSHASSLYGLRSCAMGADDLRFSDNSFDVVLCQEVVEHLDAPFMAISELLRIAKMYVIITTEANARSPIHRWLCVKTRQEQESHAERNHWLGSDFYKLFNGTCSIFPQCDRHIECRAMPHDSIKIRETMALLSKGNVQLKTSSGPIIVVKKTPSARTPTVCIDNAIKKLITGEYHCDYLHHLDSWDERSLQKIICPKCGANMLIVTQQECIQCEKCERSFGSTQDALDLLSLNIPDKGLQGDLIAISRFNLHAPETRYMQNLARLFHAPRTGVDFLFYWWYRAARFFYRLSF